MKKKYSRLLEVHADLVCLWVSAYPYILRLMGYEAMDLCSERIWVEHHFLRKRMVSGDGKRHRASWRHRCRIDSKRPNNFRGLHLVWIHDRPVVVNQCRHLVTNRLDCDRWSVRFSAVQLNTQNINRNSINWIRRMNEWWWGEIVNTVPVQNQPCVCTGCKSGRSHPLKSHMRPLVQMYFTCGQQQQQKRVQKMKDDKLSALNAHQNGKEKLSLNWYSRCEFTTLCEF